MVDVTRGWLALLKEYSCHIARNETFQLVNVPGGKGVNKNQALMCQFHIKKLIKKFYGTKNISSKQKDPFSVS